MDDINCTDNQDSRVDGPAAKKPRTIRACLQCRSRKQRCLPGSANAGLSFEVDLATPCQRCIGNGTTCSFQTDLDNRADVDLGPARLSQLVVDLHQKIDLQESRIEQLESQLRWMPIKLPHQDQITSPLLPPQTTPQAHTFVRQSQPTQPEFNMDSLQLDAPIATLQSLGAISPESMSIAPSADGRRRQTITIAVVDPVQLGILTRQDAQKAVDIYFSNCHPWAPFLDDKLGGDVEHLSSSHPLVFLAVVCIGTQFWTTSFGSSLHPRYFQLSALWDTAVSRLLLTPIPSDATIDAVCSLLLYSQWMPYIPDQGTRGAARSRYNDLSAWVVFGLAVRYAAFLGLEKTALQFQSDSALPGSLMKARIWLNIVTYDCNLTLTSGLPSSINATRVEDMACEFGRHRLGQFPGDLRYAALVELACILHRARKDLGGGSDSFGSTPDSMIMGGHPNIEVLKRANMSFEDWARRWLPKMRHTHMQHNQLPFTSLRWYQLALNSSALRQILPLGPVNENAPSRSAPLQIWILSALEISLTAAAQILFSLSTGAAEVVWQLRSQDSSTFPPGVFSVDPTARRSLGHAVDSVWISHAFALIFLVLCYIRGQVDDDMQICVLAPADTETCRAPTKPRQTSIVARLAQLAVDIFSNSGGSGDGGALRPIDKINTLVANAASLVLAPDSTTGNVDANNSTTLLPNLAGDVGDVVHEHPLQNLFDLMGDSDMTWPTTLSIFGEGDGWPL